MAFLSKALVVDDDRNIADTTALILQMSGHQPTVAYDGRQALEAARRCRPNLILMDLQMPDLDGYNAAAAIWRVTVQSYHLERTIGT